MSGTQFAIFRVVFGVYLALHFAALVPYGPELFGAAGLLPDASVNFTHGILPNPLEHFGSATAVQGFLAALTALSLLFAAGWRRPVVALLLWYGLACLFNRNNLIANPSLPYVGMLLLMCAVVPTGERKDPSWRMPVWAVRGAWILMAVGYTYSGLDKLILSPSWRDGSAILHVLNLPLARPGVLRELVLAAPEWTLQLLTWGSLALELSFLPLCLHRHTRRFAWTAMVGMHVGIMVLVNFADLSLGMLMLHLFTFDAAWLPQRWSWARVSGTLHRGAGPAPNGDRLPARHGEDRAASSHDRQAGLHRDFVLNCTRPGLRSLDRLGRREPGGSRRVAPR